MGRKPVVVVDLLLDICGNVYGSAPCTATGTPKCYNTFATCRDTTHFNQQVKVYRLTSDNAFLPAGEQIFPCITGIDIAPTKLDWKGLSLRANVQITCKDFPHHDRGIDPYWAERTTSGTFFSKLKRRNPYVVNRVLKVKTGYVDDNRVLYTEDRTYFIDSIDGPDANGKVVIKAKDLLKMGDDDAAKVPAVTSTSVAGDIAAGTTDQVALDPPQTVSTFKDYGYVRIGDEIIAYSGKGPNCLTGLTRAQFGTTAASHTKGDKIQQCVVYQDEYLENMIYDMLVNYAGVPSTYITLSDWEAERKRWFGLWKFTAVLSDPKGVNKLLEELCDSTQIGIWWDEVASQVRLKAVRVPLSTGMPDEFTDNKNLLANSVKVVERDQDRVTRVEVYFGLMSAIDDVKVENFSSLAVAVGSNEESDFAYGTVKSRQILSRWIAYKPHAEAIGRALLGRYKETPKEVTFRVDGKDASLLVGDYLDITSRLTPDNTGAAYGRRYIITQRQEVETGSHWEYMAQYVGEISHFASVVADASVSDYSSASATDKATYMYVSDSSGLVASGVNGNLIM